MRRDDRKWITQYNGLFCVLNEVGQVLTWKLTRRLSFDHVEQQLMLLNERFNREGRIVEEFYVDICCSWRKKLQKIFGPELKVYLDLFHAVQRKMPKRHPFHLACLQCLKLVFRDPADAGPERKKNTPSPAVIRQNLESFKSRWEGVSHDGQLIVTPAVLHEIRCLQRHIDAFQE